MDYVNLGRTGLKVSRICLGCMTYGSSKWRPWVLDEEASMPFFKAAIGSVPAPAEALAAAKAVSPLAGELVEPLLGMTVAPTKAHASEKRNEHIDDVEWHPAEIEDRYAAS